jgi:tetratricopeptide (TPR) repeat protein
VFESERKLRHLPFFEEVASLDEGDPAYHAATAGLVVLRLVDSWLEDGPGVPSDDGWSIRSVNAAIENVSDGTPIRVLLSRVVESLQARRPDIHSVVTPLMAYAQALEYDAKWRLAADVYQSVLAHLHPIEDSDASIAAHLRLGQCFKNLNFLDDSAAAFASASDIANQVGDIVGVLRAHVGEARLAVIRGNLPKAEELLDGTIRRAVGAQFRDVRSRALHERSAVAHFRKQYDLAIQLAYEALEHSQVPSERDRILSDIAKSFLDLGVYSAARDAYLVLSATAQEQYMRWAATLNLMEIAAQTGAEMLFELYRRELVGQAMPPYMVTAFELTVGGGYQRFGNFEKAQSHLQRAVALAGEHGFNQFLFEAEESLLQLETPPPARKGPAELSLDLQEVADAINELRNSVGAT